MICKSCKENVPSKFKFAVETNACPMCGGEILDVALWKILKDLKSLMEEAKAFMPEVEEWLFTNYSIGKNKQQVSETIDNDQISDNGNLFDTDEETIRKHTEMAQKQMASDFQKRAGIKSDGKLKSVVSQIKAASGSADLSEFRGIDPDYGEIDMSKEVAAPLQEGDAEQMASILDAQYQIQSKDDMIEQYYQIEKAKKLQNQPNGPKFSRRNEYK